MGLLDDIGGLLGGGNSLLGGLVSTALTGLALNQVTKSINRDNDAVKTAERTPEPDRGVRIQVAADTSNSVPVVYGTAVVPGIITEAVQSNNNRTMTYVLTLSEVTGVKLSDGLGSEFQFQDIYWNDQRLVFQNDGVTVSYAVDRDGNLNRNLSGLVKVWCYAGSTDFSDQVSPVGYTVSPVSAYTVVPGWTGAMVMTDLVFAVVQVNYNREQGVTGLGTMRFRLDNSMTMPGDCLLDYMTNSRYGAGISQQDILVQ